MTDQPFLTFDCENGHRFAIVVTDEMLDYEVACPCCGAPVILDTQNTRFDPRELGGDFAGPGGHEDWGQTVIDARHAILVHRMGFLRVDPDHGGRGQEMYATLFEGRINQTVDIAKVMLFGDLGCMAHVITQLYHLGRRAGVSDELVELCKARWKEMP